MKHSQPSSRSLIPPLFGRILPRFTCGLIILCTTAAIAADDEPSYDGRLLSDWLGDMQSGFEVLGATPTEKAVQAMGTNAIPTLLKWMSYEPSSSDLRREEEEKVVEWRPVTNLNRYPAQRGERASSAFAYLGAVARSTIPELTGLARTASNLKRAERFAGALADVGPEAVPSLISLTTNSPPWTRYAAIEMLGSFWDKPAVATPLVPMFMNWLCDASINTNTDYEVTGRAEGFLNAISPGLVVPALTNALQSASAFARQRALVCLWKFEMDNPTNIPPRPCPPSGRRWATQTL